MKHTLREWGVIENASLTRPLREFSADEVTQLRASGTVGAAKG